METIQSRGPKAPRLESGARTVENFEAEPSYSREIRSLEIRETDPGRVGGKIDQRFDWRSGGSSSSCDESDSDESSIYSGSSCTPQTDNDTDVEWNSFAEDSEADPKGAEDSEADMKGAKVRAVKRNLSAELDRLRPRLFEKLPSLAIRRSLGNLVERYASERPEVKITNLFDMKYEVERMLGYERFRTGPKFRVRWKGWSERWDTWEDEKTVHECGTPALRLHVSRFFLESSREGKAREHLRKYLLHAIVQNETPDCFLMSKLTNHTLEISGVHVLAPNSEVLQAMRRTIESYSRPSSHQELLQAFGGSLLQALEFIEVRLRALQDYEKWRHRIQMFEPKAKIRVENLFDCEKLPADFVYITDYDFSGRVVTESPISFCQCRSSSCFQKRCCGYYEIPGSKKRIRAYSPSRRLRREFGWNCLFECHRLCKCDMRCENRLTQRGIAVHLTIFRTAHAEWRVKAGSPLKYGTFVGEYLGEYIPLDEAGFRKSEYLVNVSPRGNSNAMYAIDGATKGNITHFFNRSANPNLDIRYVFVDNDEKNAARVAFFTSRDIAEGEELSFDPCPDTSEISSSYRIRKSRVHSSIWRRNFTSPRLFS